jgi:hypothetical protein
MPQGHAGQRTEIIAGLGNRYQAALLSEQEWDKKQLILVPRLTFV